MKHGIFYTFVTAMLSGALLFGSGATMAEKNKGDKEKKKEKKETLTPGGIPKLWRDPGNISQKDLYWGGGSPDGLPKPPFKFVKEDLKGINPKIEVTDAN